MACTKPRRFHPGGRQGSVISPLLANIYLHYVLDLWIDRHWRRREVTGDMIIVRYADDFIVGFQHESDAQRFLDEMRKRLVLLRHIFLREFRGKLRAHAGHRGSRAWPIA